MRHKPGVLILTPFYEPNTGGVETHLKDLVEYLDKFVGYRVFVLTYQPLTSRVRGLAFEESGAIQVRRISWLGFNIFHKLEPYPILEFLYITPWLFLRTVFFLLLHCQEVDVIHAQGLNASFIGCIVAFIFRKRLVTSIHAIYKFDAKLLFAKITSGVLKKSAKVLTLSRASRQELIKIGLPQKAVDVYTYWVDQECFRTIARKRALSEIASSTQRGTRNDWKEEDFIVLFAGRLIEKKGADILLEIARDIAEDITFIFVGDGPFEETVKKASQESSNVICAGKVENNNLPFYYNAASVLCVPSKYEEGFGRVIIEALSCGTPVIAANRGGVLEAIDESVGKLIEPDVESFKKAILELFYNRQELQRLKDNCRPYALKKFSAANAEVILRSYSDD